MTTPRLVSFNGRCLDPLRLAAVEMYAQRFASGAYWYDRRSGLWGRVGEGPSGRLMAGLPLGKLHAQCSRRPEDDATGVFLNGREVTAGELAHLRHVGGMMPPGRYVLEADGHMRPEAGGPRVHVFRPRTTAA